MGLGDWIMATSQVRSMHQANRRPVLIIGPAGRAMWSEVFLHNPRILRRPETNCQILRNGPGLRPYIRAKHPQRWYWKPWPIAPGEIFLSEDERASAFPYRGCVVIEPHTKVADGNKAWPWERWQAVVDALPDVRFVQVGPFNTRPLDGVELATTNFRQAMAILSSASAFVGTEGALHHAAAALDIPAVVLWSEFISPDITGYDTQNNLRHAGEACGARVPCVGCRISMGLITVDEVVSNLQEVL